MNLCDLSVTDKVYLFHGVPGEAGDPFEVCVTGFSRVVLLGPLGILKMLTRTDPMAMNEFIWAIPVSYGAPSWMREVNYLAALRGLKLQVAPPEKPEPADNGFTGLQLSVPPPSYPNGMICIGEGCPERHFPHAEPNQPDGTSFKCRSCRQR